MQDTDKPPHRRLNQDEAANYVGGMSRRSFLDFSKRNGLREIRLGPNLVRFDTRDLDDVIDRLRAAAATPSVN